MSSKFRIVSVVLKCLLLPVKRRKVFSRVLEFLPSGQTFSPSLSNVIVTVTFTLRVLGAVVSVYQESHEGKKECLEPVGPISVSSSSHEKSVLPLDAF